MWNAPAPLITQHFVGYRQAEVCAEVISIRSFQRWATDFFTCQLRSGYIFNPSFTWRAFKMFLSSLQMWFVMDLEIICHRFELRQRERAAWSNVHAGREERDRLLFWHAGCRAVFYQYAGNWIPTSIWTVANLLTSRWNKLMKYNTLTVLQCVIKHLETVYTQVPIAFLFSDSSWMYSQKQINCYKFACSYAVVLRSNLKCIKSFLCYWLELVHSCRYTSYAALHKNTD